MDGTELRPSPIMCGRVPWTQQVTERTSSPTQRNLMTAAVRTSNMAHQTSTFPSALPGSSSYQLPKMGSGRLKNGWGFNSTVSLQSGQPYQFNYNFEDDFSGSGEGDDRARIS